MAEHTKGPWKWSGPDYDKEHEPPNNCASYGLYGADDDHVLSGCGNCGNIFYNEANGALIAAAPNLLAECDTAEQLLIALHAWLSSVAGKATFGKTADKILADIQTRIDALGSALSAASGRAPTNKEE